MPVESDPTAIPWDSMDAKSRQLIRDVVNNKTIFRRMPEQTGYCDRELYDYLICHPDIVIELWELLGVTQLSLKETGTNEFLLQEGTASTSKVQVLHKSDNLCIAYAVGEYSAPVTPRKIKGDVVLILRSRFGRDKFARPVVQCNLDAYVRIHNPGAEMLAKILTPVVGKIADNNFEQAIGFVMSLSEVAQDDFEVVQAYAKRMQNIRPEVAEEFAILVEAVFDREVDRYVAMATDSRTSLDKLVRQSSTPRSADSTSTQKYNTRVGLEVETQELRFAQSKIAGPYQAAYREDDMASDESRLLVPGEMMIDIEKRFLPYDDGVVLQETTQDSDQNEQRVTKPSPALQGSMSAREILPTQPRTLSIIRDERTIDENTRKANNSARTPIVIRSDESLRTTGSTQSDRVVIGAISPRAVPSSNSGRTSPTVNTTPTRQLPATQSYSPAKPRSATQFGTTSPVIPRPTFE